MTEPLGVSPPHYETRTGGLVAPIAVYALFLITIPSLGVGAILGVVIAYVLRVDAGPVAQSHFTFQIRSFWLHLLIFPFALLLILVGVPLVLVGVGLIMIIIGGLMFGLAHLWYLLRCVVGLVHAVRGEAYPRPKSLLI